MYVKDMKNDSYHHINSLDQKETFDKYNGKDKTYIILMGITVVLLAISITFNQQMADIMAVVTAMVVRINLLTVINSLSREDYPTDDIEEDYGISDIYIR
ncbi:MAG: hypothetical protein SCK57_13070 [Bacillota bacterium]|nr:hypothetical protein [Bacillota bacterium]MDW7678586.1 hypothetical protein [Bacillota bacterium]